MTPDPPVLLVSVPNPSMARAKGLELFLLESVGVMVPPSPVVSAMLLLLPAMFHRLLSGRSMAAGVALITAFRYSSASTLLGTSWAWW